MANSGKFKPIDNRVDFVKLEHEMLTKWESEDTFNRLRKKNKNGKPWSFLDGPITANNPMGVHHAWGRSLKDIYQRYHAMKGFDQRYQNGFDCQGLWVEVEVEKELGFKSKLDIIDYGIEKFVNLCKERVKKYPFWHLIILPIKKAKSLWLWPFHSEAWPKAKISIIRNHYKSKNKSNILVIDMFRSLINDPITVISRIFLLSYKYLLFIIFIAVVLVKKKINNSSYNILYYVVVTNAVIKTIFYIQFHVLQSRLLISTFVGLEIVTIIYVYSYLEKIDLILKRD